MITSGVRVTCSRQRSQVQSAQAWQLKYFVLKIEDMSEWIEFEYNSDYKNTCL